jgi:hypothetical protein
MFALDDAQLTAGPILDCPGGASSFGAQVRARGGCVVSVDPVYELGVKRVVEQVRANLRQAPELLAKQAWSIDWSYLGSPEAYVRSGEVATDVFAADCTHNGRYYMAAALPHLPFGDRSFLLTLSSHLLFVKHEFLNYDDHLAALVELTRVTRGEVRVHPIVDTTGAIYPRLEELRAALLRHNVATDVLYIERSWIVGANQTLVCHALSE